MGLYRSSEKCIRPIDNIEIAASGEGVLVAAGGVHCEGSFGFGGEDHVAGRGNFVLGAQGEIVTAQSGHLGRFPDPSVPRPPIYCICTHMNLGLIVAANSQN